MLTLSQSQPNAATACACGERVPPLPDMPGWYRLDGREWEPVEDTAAPGSYFRRYGAVEPWEGGFRPVSRLVFEEAPVEHRVADHSEMVGERHESCLREAEIKPVTDSLILQRHCHEPPSVAGATAEVSLPTVPELGRLSAKPVGRGEDAQSCDRCPVCGHEQPGLIGSDLRPDRDLPAHDFDPRRHAAAHLPNGHPESPADGEAASIADRAPSRTGEGSC